jgi:aryl-alcohol dehydrogenase-like predicted oxidoreductase
VTPPRPSDDPRRLGSTGLAVSPIGLGLAALGRPGYINLGRDADLGERRSVAAMEARAHEVLDEAWRLGVRYLDAARSYGRAEAFLGRWLAARGIAPDDVVVGSKWGYAYTGAWRVDADVHEVKDLSLDQFRRQEPETRERLGDHLDLYQVHSLTLESGALDDRPLLAALAALKERGVRIGLSTSGPGQARTIARALEVRVDGVRLFDAVQATWNLLERSAEPALAEARAAGMGVIVKEALANGRLTSHDRDPEDVERHAILAREAERLGSTVDALAVAAAVACPWADVVLSGAVTVAQLRSNLAALEVVWDDATADRLDALVEPAEAYWARRARLPWS